MSPEDKIYWSRLSFAVLTGIICAVLKVDFQRAMSIGILMYVISYYVVMFGLRIRPSEVGGAKLLFTGIGSFILIWILTWTLLYTILLTAL